MPIALRGTGSDTNATSDNDVSPAWSVTPTNGDVLVAVIASIVQSGITVPAGWTLLGTLDAGSSLRSWAYARVASGEPSSYTWTLGSSAKSWGWIGAYSGVASASTPGWAVASPLASTAHGCPSIAVPANGWLINAGAFRRTASGSASTFTVNDGSAAERLDFSSNVGSGNDVGGAVYDSNRALAAASYARTITSSLAQDLDVMWSFALTPSDPTPPVGGTGTGARWGIHI